MIKKYISSNKKVTALILALILLMSIVSGCANNDDARTDKTSATAVETKNKKSKAKDTTKEDDNKDLEGTRTITDMAGREVEVPKSINKVFTTSPVGTIALYSIDPKKVAGLNSEISPDEAKYLDSEFQKLPVLGKYKDASSGNEEEILAANPDVIISMGDVDDKWIGDANESQERIGIPFLMIDGALDNLDETYKFLGDLLGEEERAKELGDYCKDTIENSKELASKISDDEKVSVYYADGDQGLVTNVAGSLHTQAIDIVGAKNAAEVEVQASSGGVDVSMEQVLNWNPQKIIATQGRDGSDGAYEVIKSDDKWSTIDAVKNGEVYAIPDAPFNWFDRPPSVNRILGVRWLGNILYPEVFDIDIKQETKDFYEMFYHRELTDTEVDEILENAVK